MYIYIYTCAARCCDFDMHLIARVEAGNSASDVYLYLPLAITISIKGRVRVNPISSLQYEHHEHQSPPPLG